MKDSDVINKHNELIKNLRNCYTRLNQAIQSGDIEKHDFYEKFLYEIKSEIVADWNKHMKNCNQLKVEDL